MTTVNNFSLLNKIDFPANTGKLASEQEKPKLERIDLAQANYSDTFIREYKDEEIRVIDSRSRRIRLEVGEAFYIPAQTNSEGFLLDSLKLSGSSGNTLNSNGLTGSSELDHLLLSAQEVTVGLDSLEKVFDRLVKYFEEIKNGKTSANDINDFSENISTINKLIENFGIESTIGFLMEWNFPSWWTENKNKLPNYEPPDYDVLINFAENNLDN